MLAAATHTMSTPLSRKASRGFTLMEFLMVMAIIGAMAAMTAVGFSYMTGRARASNAVFSVTSLFSLAQSRAPAQGRDQYVVVYEKIASGNTTQGVYVITFPTGTAPPADWRTVDLSAPASFGASVVERVSLGGTDTEGGAFLPLALQTFGANLPAPYSALSLTASGTSGLLAACNFCLSGLAGSSGGVVRYGVDGRMDVPWLGTTAGVVLGLGELHGTRRLRLVAISSPAGAVRVFE